MLKVFCTLNNVGKKKEHIGAISIKKVWEIY